MQFVIKATTACNFRCVYCSEGDKKPQDLSFEFFCKLVDDLPELLDEKGDKSVCVLWHGGEPLLWGLDRLDKAMAYAEQKLSSKYDLEFAMQTNGYLLDEAFMDMMQRHKLSAGVSLDGYRELQDANRPTKDGKPTFDRVMQNVQELRRRNLGGSTLMVLNAQDNIDVDKLFNFIKEYGLVCKINVLVPCGRAEGCADIDAIRDNYVRIMKVLYERAMQEEGDIIIEPLDKFMDAVISRGSVEDCSHNGHCGSSIACLYSDGTLGFCGRSIRNKEYSFGSLKEKSLKELYNSALAQEVRTRDEFLHEHDCRGCPVWYLCHGGCTVEALQANGTLFSKAPGCAARRELYQYLETTGLDLLRKKLIRQKRKYRIILEEKKKILEEVRQLAGK